MVVGDDVCDDRFLVRSLDVDVFRIEKSDKSELALGQVEGIVQVVERVGLGQSLVLKKETLFKYGIHIHFH